MNYKNITVIALTIIMAISDVNLYAKGGCSKGWHKNKKGICVKNNDKARAKEKQKNKTLNSLPITATNTANNAINAYNRALTAKTPDNNQIHATQQAALKSIDNLIAVYNQYSEIIKSGKNAVNYVARIFMPGTMTPLNQPMQGKEPQASPTNASPDATANTAAPYVSSCNDGSTAKCDDSTMINTLTCDDESTPDMNGMCADGSLVVCPQSGNNPMCTDGTSPW